MNNLKEINGFVGGLTKNPTTIFTFETAHGTWYVADGGNTINLTNEDVVEGVWIDELSDTDCITVNEPVTSLEQLEEAINS